MLIVLALLATGVPSRAFRVDYVHSGTASEERFALDRLVLEPLPWPGNPERPIDDTNSGKYRFEVRDRSSGRLLDSRGFSSIFGEWQTTGEAKQVARAFGESLRFPAPAAPVQVVLFERDERTIMFTRDDVLFCAACRSAIERILDLYAPRAGSGAAR